MRRTLLGELPGLLKRPSRGGPVGFHAELTGQDQHADLRIGLVDLARDVLAAANKLLPRGTPFHIHFSDIAFANRNETKHLPYGEGTLRAEPLRDALSRFDRPATVISESPDAASTQAIGAVLGVSSASRSS